jgi:PEP-CTERM motif
MTNLKCAIISCLILCARAEGGVIFDFDNATVHSNLPIDLTAGGITAHFSATGQGFSIQPANVLGFTPAGFSGLCIYPNSVFLSDLLVGFSQSLTDFSILYAPEEFATDSSAQIRVTAYMDSTFVGTSTATADPPGTWPTATLSFSSAQAFNRVVVHYDAPPPTGGDYGPVFMADNMRVTAVAAGIPETPEPQTYAMLLAGLGLLGFATRRRKQNDPPTT